MKKGKKGLNKLTIFLGFMAVGLTAGFINFNRLVLESRLASAKEKYRMAESMYEAEVKRGEELDSLKIDVRTRKFIEDTAREKFGLVYENEIIFEPEDK